MISFQNQNIQYYTFFICLLNLKTAMKYKVCVPKLFFFFPPFSVLSSFFLLTGKNSPTVLLSVQLEAASTEHNYLPGLKSRSSTLTCPHISALPLSSHLTMHPEPRGMYLFKSLFSNFVNKILTAFLLLRMRKELNYRNLN